MKAARRVEAKKHVLYALLLITFFSLGIVLISSASDDHLDKNHTSCVFCHRMTSTDISETNLFPEGVDPSSICLDCHHYSDNHHPVNIIPLRIFNTPESGNFPLFNGEIRCLTCHTVHGAKGTLAKLKLLRGGPYTYRTEICFICHDKELNTRISPHRMLNEQGEIRNVNGRPVCLMCHDEVPDQTTHPVQVTFKADVAFLCWRCHPPMGNNQFFKGHFLVKPKKKTLDYMNKMQEEYLVKFPLLNRDRITCSTCHNPHQTGVIEYAPAQAGTDTPGKLRMPNATICYGCHNM